MALSPHVEDKKRAENLKEIEKLEKTNTAQAADALKEKFNHGDKPIVQPATPAQTAQVVNTKK